MVEKNKLYYRIFMAIFWIAMTFGFVSQEILPFLQPLESPLYLLIDVVVLLLGCVCMRQKGDILIAVSFVGIAVVSTLALNHEGVFTFMNGLRDFIGLLFVVPILRYFFTMPDAARFRASFNRQLVVWLWLQAVCVTWQFFKYGAGDHGGGTMGFGGSGMVSMLIYLVSFYIVSQNWNPESYWRSLWANKVYVLLLYPTFLNETKISFILFMLYFILLVKYDRKLMIRIWVMLPCMILAVIGLGAVYLAVTGQDAEEVVSEEFVEEYFMGLDLDHIVELAVMIQDEEIEIDPREWWTVDIPRFAKLGLVFPKLKETGGGVMFGAGIGQFKGGQMVKTTKFYFENEWLLQGSRPMSFFMLVQLGIIGLIWLVAVLMRDIFVPKSRDGRGKKMRFFIMVAVMLIMMYNDSLRDFKFCIVLFYLAMEAGYAGISARKGRACDTEDEAVVAENCSC